MKRINITQAAVIGVAGLLGIASIATAADKKPTAKPATPAYTDPASLPKFANVKVVNATPEQRAASAAEAHKKPMMMGQKAYIDPATRQLRAATAEEAAAEAAPAAAAASAPASSPEMRAVPSGGTVIYLDDSSNVYSVASIGADGKVKQICLDTPVKNEADLAVAAKAAQESSHEK